MTSLEWRDEEHVVVMGASIRCMAFGFPDPDVLQLSKVRAHAELFVERIEEFRGGSILELGIAGGGSVALLAGAIEPKRLVALELDADRVAALDAFIESNGLGEVIRPYYGVDQGNRARLAEIVEREFADMIDLIIDDASHLYGPTRTSFESLFPCLGEGGVYMVEDWKWEHVVANVLADSSDEWYAPAPLEASTPFSRAVVRAASDRFGRQFGSFREHVESVLTFLQKADVDTRIFEADREPETLPEVEVTRTPLSSLLTRILMLQASTEDVIRDIHLDANWFAVRRGSAPMPEGGLDLDAALLDCFGQLKSH